MTQTTRYGKEQLLHARTWTVGALLSAGILLGLAGTPLPAAAQINCGDTIGPNQSVTLQADLTCPGGVSALTVTGPAALNLNGHRIICQNGNDGFPGILVLGERAQVRNGTVRVCFVGVLIAGVGNHRVEQVATEETCDSGFLVAGAQNNTLTKNLANRAGRHSNCTAPRVFGPDGFTINGNNNHLTDNTATNSDERGFTINGDGNRLDRNTAAGNDNDGFHIESGADGNQLTRNLASNNSDGFDIGGTENRLRQNTAVSNRDSGFDLDGDQNQLIRNLAVTNGENGADQGFEVDGNENLLRQNQALSNTGSGIGVDGQNNTIRQNVARQNGGDDLVDANADCDNNQWRQNTFLTSSAPVGPNPPCIQ